MTLWSLVSSHPPSAACPARCLVPPSDCQRVDHVLPLLVVNLAVLPQNRPLLVPGSHGWRHFLHLLPAPGCVGNNLSLTIPSPLALAAAGEAFLAGQSIPSNIHHQWTTMDSSGQQLTTICSATCICDAVFWFNQHFWHLLGRDKVCATANKISLQSDKNSQFHKLVISKMPDPWQLQFWGN